MAGLAGKALLPVAIAAIAACGAATRPSEGGESGLPLVIPTARARAASEPERAAPPLPPEPGEELPPCPLRWKPRPLEGSVITIPADLARRMFDPLYAALCACTRPGQRIALVARMIPEHGEVTAKTSELAEDAFIASPPMDACLAKHLGSGRYEAFRVGSDNIPCEAPRPRERSAGSPAPFEFPRPACAPREDAFTTIVYPLRIDRTAEGNK